MATSAPGDLPRLRARNGKDLKFLCIVQTGSWKRMHGLGFHQVIDNGDEIHPTAPGWRRAYPTEPWICTSRPSLIRLLELPTRKNLDPNSTANPGEDATYRLHTPHEAEDLRLFEKAMVKFNSGRFVEAKHLFEQLTNSSDRGLADAARQRKRMCERRIPQGVDRQ